MSSREELCENLPIGMAGQDILRNEDSWMLRRSMDQDRGNRAWMYSHADKLALAVLFLSYLAIAFRQLDYAGDGVRHLEHILQSNTPVLGEPRWILFPSLLFAVIKPFVAVGIVHTIPQATKVFCFFNVTCGFCYLVCLRRWLAHVSAMERAAALLLAGGSCAFLTLATDTIEPTAAALIAVAGLMLARFGPAPSKAARVSIAIASLAFAALIYQGLLFGFFLLPAVFPVSLLASRRVAWRLLAGALAVPLVTVMLLWMGGDTPRNAVRRFLQGEANATASKQYSKVSAKNLAGVAIVGPAYALASIPDLRGLSGTMRLLRHSGTAIQGLCGGLAWCVAAVGIIAAILRMVWERQFALLGAFAGMMLLPAIRMAQYSYMKYYALLPLLAVLTVSRLGIRWTFVGCLGTLLLLSNFAQIWARTTESEILRARVVRELYPRIPQGTCFLTDGWGPAVPDWQGEALSWARILNGAGAASQPQIARANSQQLRERLKELFWVRARQW